MYTIHYRLSSLTMKITMNVYDNIFPELKRRESNLSMSIIFATTIWRTSSLEKMKYMHTLYLSYLTSNFFLSTMNLQNAYSHVQQKGTDSIFF